MRLHELQPAPGSVRARKRLGRGHGSGTGTTAGKGTKGQKARTGKDLSPFFEGGQLPLHRRLPTKRGFTNIFKTGYQLINLEHLGGFASGSEVTPESLAEAGLIRHVQRPVKILGRGEVNAALAVKVHKVSASARGKIEAAGGTVAEIGEKRPETEMRDDAASGR